MGASYSLLFWNMEHTWPMKRSKSKTTFLLLITKMTLVYYYYLVMIVVASSDSIMSTYLVERHAKTVSLIFSSTFFAKSLTAWSGLPISVIILLKMASNWRLLSTSSL